jgi:hypothetical protein
MESRESIEPTPMNGVKTTVIPAQADIHLILFKKPV